MYKDLKDVIDTFVTFEDAEWNFFKKLIKTKIFNKGAWLIQEGKIEHYLYFIVEGGVRVYYLKEGKENNIDFKLEQQFVNSYASFLTQSPSSLYIEALEDTTCYMVEYHDLQSAYNLSKNGEHLGRLNAELLFTEKESHISSLILDSAYDRVNRLFNEKRKWLQRIPQKYLASYLNMTPETFSRVKRRIANPLSIEV